MRWTPRPASTGSGTRSDETFLKDNDMAQFTAKDVQTLRHATGVGMMDAKKALVECDGDMDKAKGLLREKGLADVKKRAGRDANQGTVGYYMHQPSGYPTVGVIVELASETDFVAKSPSSRRWHMTLPCT